MSRPKGFKHSEETKKKISEANKGKPKPWFKGKKQSPEWIEKRVSKSRGEKHWNYGGISPNRGIPMTEEQKEKIRQAHLRKWDLIGRRTKRPYRHAGWQYNLWRKKVYERDNYTCRICGQKGGYLQADHIKSWFQYPELRYDVNNGRTLCFPCHKLTDTYGYKGRLEIARLSVLNSRTQNAKKC